MIHTEVEAVIQRPIDEVFAFLSDFAALPDWQPEFTEVVRLTEGPPRAGTSFRYRRKLPIGSQQGTMEFTEYEANRSFTWRALGGPVLPRGRMTFEAVDGGTRVHETFEAEVRWPLKLLLPLLARQFAKDARDDLLEAKRRLEANPVGP